jgi:translation elongation factor EF-Tu-like GTPase
MEFLFMKGWNYGQSIVVRSSLLKDIVTTQSLAQMKNRSETIPKDLEEGGEEIDRFDLRDKRYQLATDITILLTNELTKANRQQTHNDNPQILVNLLQKIICEENTHFRFG